MATYVNTDNPNGPKGWHHVDLAKDGVPVLVNVVYTEAYDIVLLTADNADWYIEPACSSTGQSVRAMRENIVAHADFYHDAHVAAVRRLLD